MRLHVIACEIVFREMSLLAARSHNIVDVTFMPKGLHDIETGDMVAKLQAEIDSTDAKVYDAVCLAYGLCNNGTVGLRAPEVPLVIPRAHDCITFFLGSKERYRQEFDACPGTYYRTVGWLERDFAAVDGRRADRMGTNFSKEELVAKYGEEMAEYILSQTTGWVRNYTRLAYIDTGVAEFPEYQVQAEEEATGRGWRFEKLAGDLSLLRKLTEGQWDDEAFLVIQPGKSLAASYDDNILKVEGAT